MIRRPAFRSAASASRVSSKAVVNGYSSPPRFELGDLTVHQSDCSGCAGLYVRVCDLPVCTHFMTMERSENAYHFYYDNIAIAEWYDPALTTVDHRITKWASEPCRLC